MTGMSRVGLLLLSSWRTSSPDFSGMAKSSRMTSGSLASAISRPAFPSYAWTTEYPSPANRSAIRDLIQGSSSTTRTVLSGRAVVLMLGSPLLRGRIRVAALRHLHAACHTATRRSYERRCLLPSVAPSLLPGGQQMPSARLRAQTGRWSGRRTCDDNGRGRGTGLAPGGWEPSNVVAATVSTNEARAAGREPVGGKRTAGSSADIGRASCRERVEISVVAVSL